MVKVSQHDINVWVFLVCGFVRVRGCAWSAVGLLLFLRLSFFSVLFVFFLFILFFSFFHFFSSFNLFIFSFFHFYIFPFFHFFSLFSLFSLFLLEIACTALLLPLPPLPSHPPFFSGGERKPTVRDFGIPFRKMFLSGFPFRCQIWSPSFFFSFFFSFLSFSFFTFLTELVSSWVCVVA